MVQSKKEEWRKYISKLKASGKYEIFLAKRKGSRRRLRAKFRAEHPEEARERDRTRNRKYIKKLKTENNSKGYTQFLEKRRKPARLRYHEKLGNVDDIGKYRKKLAERNKSRMQKLKETNGGEGYKRLRERENLQRRERLAKMKAENREEYQEYLMKNRERAARRRKRLSEEQSKKD